MTGTEPILEEITPVPGWLESRWGKALVFCLCAAMATALGWLLVVLLQNQELRQVKYGMCFAAMLAVSLGWLASRREWKTLHAVVCIALTAMLFSSAWMGHQKKFNKLIYKQKVHAWNVFHYVLGTKYFDELGYFDLYKGVVLADREKNHYFAKVPLTRDMRTYRDIPVKQAIVQAQQEGIREKFTDERWENFKNDLAAIQKHRSKRGWAGTLRDLGYNPSPAWLIVHRPLLNWVDVSNPRTLQLLCAAELVLYFLAFFAAWWGFGLRTALTGSLWLSLYFGNENLMVGSYFHYDWLFFTILAVALYKKKRPLLAAPVLAYVAMMRGFPGFLAIHPALCWTKDLLRFKRPNVFHTKFLVTLIACCLAIVVLGSTTARGPGAWLEWKEKISLHAKNHPLFAKRIALKHLFVHDTENLRKRMTLDQRAALIEKRKPYYHVAAAALVILTLAAMLRRNDHDGMILGIVVIFAVLVLSRYYASVWALLFTLTAMDRWKLGNLLSSMGLFGMVAFFYGIRIHLHTPGWTSFLAFNSVMTAYFLAILVWFLAGDAFALWKKKEVSHSIPATENQI